MCVCSFWLRDPEHIEARWFQLKQLVANALLKITIQMDHFGNMQWQALFTQVLYEWSPRLENSEVALHFVFQGHFLFSMIEIIWACLFSIVLCSDVVMLSDASGGYVVLS